MRRLLLLVAPLALVAAGCGGGGGAAKGPSHSVLEVSKAFYDAGLPFTGIVTGNPYVTGQTPFLPAQLNKSDVRFDVLAELSGTNTSDHTGEVVWVTEVTSPLASTVTAVGLPSGSVTRARWPAAS